MWLMIKLMKIKRLLKGGRLLSFCSWLKEWLSRADLMNRFGLKEAAATRDLGGYREIASHNLEFNPSLKRYEIKEQHLRVSTLYRHPQLFQGLKVRRFRLILVFGTTNNKSERSFLFR